MAGQVAGFPYWELTFDERGRLVEPLSADAVHDDIATKRLTDLFVFAHGWNNDVAMARSLYRRIFEQLRTLLDTPPAPHRRAANIGVVGVIWPARLWPDETPPPEEGGEAASLADDGELSDAAQVRALKDVYPAEEDQRAIDELAQLLEDQPDGEAPLKRFQDLMKQLTSGGDAAPAPEDNGPEQGLLREDPREVFQRFQAKAPAPPDDGGAAFDNPFATIWNGAKEALRQATYWEMKKRAGVVGKEGLGPFIGGLHIKQDDLRVHLLGHSFGARLVSFALAGLPDFAGASPVKSLFLLQGAFSHYSFAQSLPHDGSRAGALAGMAQRVDGPLLTTHSRFDTAVGTFYPLASFSSGDDAAGLGDELQKKWAGMGHDGAQAVGATEAMLDPVGSAYQFEIGKFTNLDGNELIIKGRPPSGAHGDIFHAEVAWAALVAAGIGATAGRPT